MQVNCLPTSKSNMTRLFLTNITVNQTYRQKLNIFTLKIIN